VVACLLPQAAVWMLGGFVLVVMLSGYVSLATLCAAALGLFQVSCVGPQGLLSPAGLFLLGMNGLLFWKHRHNLLRLYRGTESRFERARVLGRWLRR
jgi:acyl phosphate:glycerol-3-phosphate acyltransferase